MPCFVGRLALKRQFVLMNEQQLLKPVMVPVHVKQEDAPKSLCKVAKCVKAGHCLRILVEWS
jgi:hypothetical protein